VIFFTSGVLFSPFGFVSEVGTLFFLLLFVLVS